MASYSRGKMKHPSGQRLKRDGFPAHSLVLPVKYTFYEFFCGGGMARIGLGPKWECLFANDFDKTKAACYEGYFGHDNTLITDDIANISSGQLPGRADLAWASFPCQDLSLAGNGVGLSGHRSGTFWPFWNLIKALNVEGRKPRAIVLENVYGAITSHGGRDLAIIFKALSEAGYRFGPLVIDAERFLPHSRPRLFILAIDDLIDVSESFISLGPVPAWHPDSLGLSYEILSAKARMKWLWWKLPIPSKRATVFADLIEDEPHGVKWHTSFETAQLLEMMSLVNRAKVEQAKDTGVLCVGALYRRTRIEAGVKRQRAEVRFDEISGCLRTPAGGSSRQIILFVKGQKLRSRLLSPREAARLMGLPEDYRLPARYNDAYKLAGDGVAIPVVRHITDYLLEPVLAASASQVAA